MKGHQRTPEGDQASRILKSWHIFRKRLVWRIKSLEHRIKVEKSVLIKAEMIQSVWVMSAILKSVDETINEFRSDGEKAGALWPRTRKPKAPPEKKIARSEST